MECTFQMLTIHLEETDCFAAWVSAREVGMVQSTDGSDPKCWFCFPWIESYSCVKSLCHSLSVYSFIPVNFGGLILQALLEHWPRTHAPEIMGKNGRHLPHEPPASFLVCLDLRSAHFLEFHRFNQFGFIQP